MKEIAAKIADALYARGYNKIAHRFARYYHMH